MRKPEAGGLVRVDSQNHRLHGRIGVVLKWAARSKQWVVEVDGQKHMFQTGELIPLLHQNERKGGDDRSHCKEVLEC